MMRTEPFRDPQMRGVSPGSVTIIHIVPPSMLGKACRWGWRERNPAMWVEKPTIYETVPVVPTPAQWDAEVDPWAVVVRHGRRYLLCHGLHVDAIHLRLDRIGHPEP